MPSDNLAVDRQASANLNGVGRRLVSVSGNLAQRHVDLYQDRMTCFGRQMSTRMHRLHQNNGFLAHIGGESDSCYVTRRLVLVNRASSRCWKQEP